MKNFIVYKKNLPEGASLAVYNNDDLIFTSCGKWLYPLFEFELFLNSYSGPHEHLAAHDTVIGKAAAVLMLHLGITHIYANLASRLAVEFIEKINQKTDQKIDFAWGSVVDRLLCATEGQLEDLNDIDEMYRLILQRNSSDRRKN